MRRLSNRSDAVASASKHRPCSRKLSPNQAPVPGSSIAHLVQGLVWPRSCFLPGGDTASPLSRGAPWRERYLPSRLRVAGAMKPSAGSSILQRRRALPAGLPVSLHQGRRSCYTKGGHAAGQNGRVSASGTTVAAAWCRAETTVPPEAFVRDRVMLIGISVSLCRREPRANEDLPEVNAEPYLRRFCARKHARAGFT